MPASASLKPTLRASRQQRGVAAWAVNVPPYLSPTGKRQELFFASKIEGVVMCEQFKA